MVAISDLQPSPVGHTSFILFSEVPGEIAIQLTPGAPAVTSQKPRVRFCSRVWLQRSPDPAVLLPQPPILKVSSNNANRIAIPRIVDTCSLGDKTV